MKYAYALLPALALAQPLHQHKHDKRDLVTNVVHATRVLYQDAVVYVDNQGNPWSTEVKPVSTNVQVPQQQQSSAPAPAPTSTQESQPQPSDNQQNQLPKAEVAPPSSAPSPSTSSPAPAPSPSSSSQQQQQQQPSSQPQQQQPPTTQVVATSSSPAPQPSPSSSSGSDSGSGGNGGGSGQTFSGDATYYTPGMGSCGETNTENDMIVALNKDQFNSGPNAGVSNGNSNCGKKIRINRGGKHVDVTVADMCPGCNHGSLDLSPAAFDKIASQSEGRVQIDWQWI